MTTKKVELWCDLWPGWQDSPNGLFVYATPLTDKMPNTKRIKITVELPCFGGSAEQDGSAIAVSEVIKKGLQS